MIREWLPVVTREGTPGRDKPERCWPIGLYQICTSTLRR